jgi:hypothetical protein
MYLVMAWNLLPKKGSGNLLMQIISLVTMESFSCSGRRPLTDGRCSGILSAATEIINARTKNSSQHLSNTKNPIVIYTTIKN